MRKDILFYIRGMDGRVGLVRQLGKLCFRFLLPLLIPIWMRAQITPDFEARILPSRGGGDSIVLEIQYRFISGFANQNDSLGFSNFAISILPLGATNIPAATLIPGSYFWGDPGPNSQYYLPIQVGGINFLNVTVRRRTTAPPGVPLIPTNWTTVAKVYLPLNFCPDTLWFRWRKVPDGLGGSGVIMNWNGTVNLKDSTLFHDTFLVLPKSVGGILTSDTLICAGDSVKCILSGYSGDSIRWQLSSDGISWSTLPIPTVDTLILNTLTDTTYVRAFVYTLCDTSYSNRILIHVNQPPSFTYDYTFMTICFPNSTPILPGAINSGSPFWTTPNGQGGFHDATNPSTYYVPSIADTGKTIHLALWVTTPGCDTGLASSVDLTVLPPVAGRVEPGYFPLLCVNDTSDTLNGEILFGDRGSWRILSGGGTLYYPNPVDSSLVQYLSVSGDANQMIQLAYVVKSSQCGDSSMAIATLFVSDSARGAVATPRDTICNGATLSLDGSVTSGFGMWTSTGKGVFSNPFNPTGTYTATNDTGSVILLWVVTSGVCPPDVNVKQLWVDLPPLGDFPVAPDTICAGSSTLPLGATLTRGVGHWETPNGQGYFAPNPFNPNAIYVSDTNDAGKDIILRWIVVNGACPPDTNTQKVYVRSTKIWGDFHLNPAYDSLCVSDTTPPLNATVTYGTGSWSTTGGGVFLPSVTNPTARYVPSITDAGNTIQLIWTITQPGCNSRVISQPLYVAPLPLATIAVGRDTICEGDSTVPLGGLAGNGSGFWESDGNGEFHYNGVRDSLNPNAYYVSQTGDGGTLVQVRWIVSNGLCPNDTAIASVLVNLPAAGFFNPPTPNPICAGSATDLLDAGITSGLFGYWSCSGCNGSFSDTTLPRAQYLSSVSDAGNTLTLQWNVASPGCDTVTYSRTLNVSSTILSGSFPGPLSPICVKDTTDTLRATVSAGGAGKWVTTGSGHFIPNDTDPNARYVSDAADAGDTITIVWKIYDPSGACDTSYFYRDLIVYDSSQGFIVDPITLSLVGTLRDTVCYLTIAGPYRGRVVTGTNWGWAEDGAGALSVINDSTVEYVPALGDVGRERHVYWVVKNGVCPEDTSVVNIFFSPQPIGNFSPAPPPTCAGFPTDSLNGQIISGMGGYWSTPNGLGSFADPLKPRTVYNSSPVEGGSTVTLLWIVTSPRCTPDTSVQTVSIVNTNVTGSILNPQPDSLCKGAISDSIYATVTNGIGQWSCVGCNGTILPSVNDTAIVYHSDLSDPDSVRLIFTLQDSFGLCNAQQFVKVLYLFRPRKANLLTTKLDPICIGDTTDTIFVNTSFDTVGYWSCLSCNGAFTDTFSVKTQYVADTLDANQILELLWIAVDPNGVCLPDTAVITVRVDTFSIGQFPTVPIPDICAEDTTIPLQAVAITGVGFWTCPNCNGGFTLPLSGNSKYVSIRADGGDTLLITWNVVNGACDTVRYVDSLYVYKKPEGGLTSTVPLQLCVGVSSSPLPGYLVAGTGSGHWVDPTGMGSFLPDSSQPNAQYRPDTALFSGVDSVYFLTWEIWNGPCDTQRYDLQVDLYKPPYGIFSLANDTLCAGASTGPLGAFVQAPNTGQWYTPNGSGYFTSVTNPNAAYQSAFADSGKTILLAWVIDNAACPPDTLWDSLYVKTSGFGVAFRDTLICSGDTIQLFAFGMNFYSWSPNSATLISNPYVPDPYVFPSDTTIYVVTGRDTFGCEISDTVKVWVKPKLPLVVSNDTTICFGDTVPLFVSGATSVIWSPDTFLTNNTSLSPLAFPSYTITYMVKGLVPNGCWSDEQVTITVKPTPAPIVVANDVCMGYGQLLYTLNDTLCAQKNWFRGDRNAVRSYGPPYDSTHPLFYGSTNTIMPPTDSLGTFTYTVVCVSADGCVGMDDATYTVHPVPVANFYAIYPPTGDTVNTVPYANPTVQFINTSIGAVKFLWDFGDPLSGPFNTDTTASPTHTFVGAGPHTIVLYVENSLGCSDLEVKSNYITVLEQDYYFPNAFSPNGDGVNDRFRPLPADGTARILLFEIYDRWGNKVFETTSNQGWDGNTNDGKPLDPGVYSYKCIIDLDSRGPKVYTGYVTLIR